MFMPKMVNSLFNMVKLAEGMYRAFIHLNIVKDWNKSTSAHKQSLSVKLV